jgi:hypothetical protein
MTNLNEKKQIVTEFLERCNAYTNDMMERYVAELADAEGMQRLEIQDKISHWTTYKAFNEYAISELQTAELDDWFDEKA